MNAIGAALERVEEMDRENAASPFSIRLLGDPILTTPCVKVPFKEHVPEGLIEAMHRLCNEWRFGFAPGVGISANQCGSLARICLAPIEKKRAILINPRIVRASAATVLMSEGCLSIPGFYTNVLRPARVTVAYEDEEFDTRCAMLEGFEARVVQHEIDHLDGKLLTDGLTRQQRRNAERCVEKCR